VDQAFCFKGSRVQIQKGRVQGFEGARVQVKRKEPVKIKLIVDAGRTKEESFTWTLENPLNPD
jgi:hypothetical protein